jgi:hypothetical protein
MDKPIEIQDKDMPKKAEITADTLMVTLGDGRVLGVPLAWYPFLANATPEQRQAFELLPNAILWDKLDDGISVDTLIRDIARGKAGV